MKCETAREWILSDYLDGQMSPEQKKAIETHLTGCIRCRDFEAAARKAVIEPFKGAARVSPPEALWHKIKERIKEEEGGKGRSLDLISRMKTFLYFPKPAFILTTAVMIFFLAVILIKMPPKNKEAVSVNSKEQIEYMVDLVEGPNRLSMDWGEDYGTSMEEYFL
jgi:hypothetical protein